MILLESLMMTVMICTCLAATYTDFKKGIIPNKLIIAFGAAELILNAVYYSFFAGEMFIGFLVNLGVSVLLAVVLYAYHFWGAGDSKLMMLVVLSIPARFYGNGIFSLPTLNITVHTFAVAFIYLIFESIVLGIMHKDLFKLNAKLTKSSILSIIKSYAISYVYIILISFAINLILGGYVKENSVLLPLCNFFIVFAVLNLELFKKWYMTAAALLTDIVLLIMFRSGISYMMPSIWNVFIIAAVLIFRSIAEKYNYKVIPVSEVKPGVVLTIQTVMLFRGSRVKGLPESTTEDFRSRISEEEAESIKRWEFSKTGVHEITIVRKIPFAVFILIGTIIFLILRMWVY